MKEDVALFDAPFFSITAAEAEAMDPQQRLILEAAYRALENAGITMEGIARSKTCVFAGSSGHEYLMLQAKDPQYLQKWGITGTTGNMVANRISWFFDLIGPSAAIDTACSSSLMAIDMACQSIWSGDSTMGLAIGSNVILALEASLMINNLGLLSKDSRCYSFDERGNGYARGEGVGVLVIRPLEDAVRDGDTVRAVIRSSASNQDGRTTGITLPSTEMQATLIQEVYRKAGLDMATTRYFEAHGTAAIGSVFRPHHSLDNPLYIGSVKSNIGHLEGASGVAGVIKTVLALEKGIIPPNSVNLQSLNPRIDDEFLNIKFPQKALSWPSEGLRRASVSSFGHGGSNAHIVLDDAYNFMKLNDLKGNHNTVLPFQPSKCRDCALDAEGEINSDGTGSNGLTETTNDTPKLLVWSAADEKGILRLKETWKSRFSTITQSARKNPKFLNDLAHTLACRRTHLSWRSFAVVRPSDDLGVLIDRFSPASQSRGSSNLAMVFSGQGAQWYAMGRQLLNIYPVFLQSIEDAGEYLQTLGCKWMPLDELERNESTSNINKTEYSQILCTILQVALVDLLRSVNITPKAVLGHSSGEVAAAYCARAISRQSAWKVSYYRGYMSSKLENSSQMRGSMLAVGLSEQGIKPYIDKLSKDLEVVNLIVGCINSPKSVTVTGEVTYLDSLKSILDKENILCRRLKVNLAYHSSQMKEVASLYQAAMGELEVGYTGHKSSPEMVSSVTGDWIDPEEVAQAGYWVKNMVSPVRFSDGLTRLFSGSAPNSHKRLDGSHRRTRDIDHILEVGPHSVLQGACKDVLKNIENDTPTEYFSLLVRNMSAADTVFAVFGNLHTAGYPIDLSLVNGIDFKGHEIPKSLPDLPEYPFNHDTSYWHESKISKDHRLHPFGRNDLLGVSDPNCNHLEMRWRNFVRVSEMPWTKDHQVNGTIIYPGAGMLVMAIEAAKQVAEQGRTITGFNIQEARFHAAMIVPPGTHGIETSFYLHPAKGMDSKSSSSFEFRLCTCENEEWIENCTGSIQIVYTSEEELEMDKVHTEELWSSQLEAYSDAIKACTLPVEGPSLYDRFLNSGYDYGEAFQLIDKLSISPVQPCVTAQVKRFRSSTGETIHPTTLDAILQTSIWTEVASETENIPTTVPKYVRNLWVASAFENTPSGILRTYATRTVGSSFPSPPSDIFTFDEALRETLISVEGLETDVNSSENTEENAPSSEDLCYQVQWKPDLNLLSNRETTDLCIKECPYLTEDTEDFLGDLDFVFMARITETLKILSEQQLKPSQPHLKKYVDWMMDRQHLLDKGLLQFATEPLKSRLVDLGDLQDVENRLLNLNKRGYFYVTVARNLLEFLTGEMDPSTLFEGDMLKEFYSGQLHESHGLRQAGKYLDLLSHLNPKMKILEVGAGIGSMTEVMLRTLGNTETSEPQYAQWDFTDKSGSSFASAQDQFHQEAGRMKFKLLDIEQDPEKQEFECGTYDIVVASMVIHATSNIKDALGNARKLLKPGGKLMLYEMVGPGVRSTFTFGLLERFWPNSVADSRPGPCFDERQWDELLLQTGFSGLDLLLPEVDGTISHEFGLIVSTAAEEPPAAYPVPEIEIVYDVAESGQQELAQFLVKYCQSNKLAPVRSSSVQEAMEYTSENPLLRIFLLELHIPILSEIQSELFQQLRSLLSSTSQALWINQGGGIFPSQPQFRLVDGLFRVLMTEDSKR
ncbi:hypothetical protein VN97_g3381 [Penicillium thymicola]|uniref:Uncharacterized protein n=1 Tax=Penicillium thymicola TaxID=293382 RepID=A0AAI9TMJ4_PENTH|nr:hypothetical protein VN97_g3381 [Penicillium thymicola]